MSSRELHNVGLHTDWDLGEDGWKAGMDRNLLRLDTLVQARVLGVGENSPPPSPSEGDVYIIGESPTGVWSGYPHHVAVRDADDWAFIPPKVEWTMRNIGDGGEYRFTGAEWVLLPGVDTDELAQAVAKAEAGADRAEVAASAAFVNADVYADIAAGLAGTSNGNQFQVLSGPEIVRYRNENGVAVEVARYPGSEFVRIALDVASQPGLVSGEFRTAADDDQPAFALIDEHGNALLAWAEDGEMLVPDDGLAVPLMPYLDGSELRAVGSDDVLAADLGTYQALSIAPGGPGHVRAVLDWPAISATRSVSAAQGLLVPDSDQVLHVVVGLGQSLMVGAASASSLVSIEPVWPDDTLMFDSGPNSDVRMGLTTQGDQPELDPDTLTGFLPLVARAGQGTGSRGETAMESSATALAQQARDIGTRFRSLSFTAAQGGSGYNAIKRGSIVYTNMLLALEKAKALAAEQGWRVIVDGCIVKHGEGDQSNTDYLNALIEWQSDVDADVKTITGQVADVHFIIGQPSSHTTATPRAIQAMLDAHNTSPVHHLAGPDYPFGDTFHTDYLHFTGPGYYMIGEQVARAWKQSLWSSGGKSRITQITAASRSGTAVTLTYEVPAPPLAFDTEVVTERDAKGFRFADGSGDIEILDVEITDDGVGTGVGEITLTLAAEPSGNEEAVLYALSPQTSPREEGNIPRGNLRDSAPETSRYDGRRLYNWAVHQRFDLN